MQSSSYDYIDVEHTETLNLAGDLEPLNTTTIRAQPKAWCSLNIEAATLKTAIDDES